MTNRLSVKQIKNIFKKLEIFSESPIRIQNTLHKFSMLTKKKKKMNKLDDITTLSELIYKHKNYQNDDELNLKSGNCVICGKNKEGLNPKKAIKNNFTAYELLQNGTVVCLDCYNVINDSDIRRKNWIVTKNKFKDGFKKYDLFNIIESLSKEDVPFMISITKTYKKHGWLYVVNDLNYSLSKFYITFEDRKILIDVEKFKEMEIIAKKLYKHITKTELLNGIYSTSWKKIIENKLFLEVKKLKEYRKTQLFKLVIFCLNKQKKKKVKI